MLHNGVAHALPGGFTTFKLVIRDGLRLVELCQWFDLGVDGVWHVGW